VFDARLRQTKQQVFAPIVSVLASVFAPVPLLGLTMVGLVLGLASAVAAADARWLLALGLFFLNRAVDGLDGEVARARSEATDKGGYADMVVDTIVYAAIPLGAATGSDIDHIWPLTALLLGSFYLNTITWAYLAALIEKRGRTSEVDSSVSGSTTSIVMPVGLVEGAETVVFFAIMLTLPAWLDWTMGAMAAAVFVGAGLRFIAGHRGLRSSDKTAERVHA